MFFCMSCNRWRADAVLASSGKRPTCQPCVNRIHKPRKPSSIKNYMNGSFKL